jgi:large subunit ribosomal protein L4
MMASLKVLDTKGKETGSLDLKPDVFGEVNVPLLHQAVVRELADRRVGTHDTKGRSEVSGGGKKPWKQKGTGRARQGSIRATQWKGGGKPFGPTPRSYDKDMPREMRREALRCAVSSRVNDGEVTVVEALGGVDGGKTKALVGQLATLGVVAQRTLVVVSALGDPLRRAARNVPWLTVVTPGHVSTYQLMQARRVVFERAAFVALEEALAR